MVTVTTKNIKLSEIKLNCDNPRTISMKAMAHLIKSIQEFPDMLQLREIVIDETRTVLGGNMRVIALRKIGVKDCMAKVVTGLTPEQKREFVIKDNSAFGEWNFDELANSWTDLPLVEWGVNLPEDWMSKTPENQGDGLVPQKDPNILVRISIHPGMWLGKRKEILSILEKMKQTYNLDFRVEE